MTEPTTIADPDLRLGATWPDLPTFVRLAADRRVIPVVRRLMADAETPIGLYRKLAGNRSGTFLLESAEHGLWSRWSFIGVDALATLTEVDGEACWIGSPPVGIPTSGNPLVAVRDTMTALATPALPGLPPLTGGLVGTVGYDAIRHWMTVPDMAQDDLGLPMVGMILATDLAVLDHRDGSVLLIANAINVDNTDERVDEAWYGAIARLDRMTTALAEPAPSTVAVMADRAADHDDVLTGSTSSLTPERFREVVTFAQDAIAEGRVGQVVLSQRFDVPCPAEPLDVYRALRSLNPSPYMYLLRLPHPDGSSYDLVGSSPEALVRVTDRRVITHPIAGTRPRGASPEADATTERDLLADPKERSEHDMLVVLGTDDLGKVCDPDTVETIEYMGVHRYSHVMHLESTIVGTLRPECTAYDALVATFPAGTLTGAPRSVAVDIIERCEPVRRGLYGGVVGYLDFRGDMDFAIAIRTAIIENGTAHVQAGAGVVAASVPEREFDETVAKASAVLRAVASAGSLREIGDGASMPVTGLTEKRR